LINSFLVIDGCWLGKNKPRRIRVLDEIVCFRLYSVAA